MTIIQKLQAAAVISKVAKRRGIPTPQCRAEMTTAIIQAWESSDPVIRQRQVQLVGEERIPTPEEFIILISSKLPEDFT